MTERNPGALAVTMAEAAGTGGLAGPGGWGDRLSRRISAGPVPAPIVYTATWAVVFALLTASQWAAGSYPVGTYVPLHAVLAAGVTVPVWLIDIFNRSAVEAMHRVRPLLAMSDDEAAALTARLVRMPILIEVGFAAFWVLMTALRVILAPASTRSLNLVFEGPAGAVGALVMVLYIGSFSSYVVKIGHLGWGVYQITKRDVAVSLFELGPLNGFAVLTARIAGSLILLAVAIYTSRPSLLEDPFGVGAGLLGLAFAAAVFVLPLRGVHDRLESEKERLLGEATKAMERSIRDLNAAIEAGDLASMDGLNKGISAVEVELRTLAAVPTWPWSTDTFRWVVGALMFPIVLFLVQLAITTLVRA